MFFSNIMENAWTDFHEIFMKCQARHKKLLARLLHTCLNCFKVSHLGAAASLLVTSRNNGWMDIHEIFRIWTQGATGYTVSQLNRLFHILKTRRGGGLRSQDASCHRYVNILQVLALMQMHPKESLGRVIHDSKVVWCLKCGILVLSVPFATVICLL